MRLIKVTCSVVCLAAGVAQADEPDTLLTSPLAQAFGSAPVLWSLALSPDGTKLAAIQMHPDGMTLGRVVDFTDGSAQVVLAGKADDFDITWCDWANDSRLLCGLQAIIRTSVYIPVRRLVAVNADGSDMRMLLERRLEDQGFTQIQDQIVDWLPDEPDNVLVQVPSPSGSGVARLNVYTGALVSEDRNRERVFRWVSDGHGTPRLYQSVTGTMRRWYVRNTPESAWTLLEEKRLTDLESSFRPIGFGEERNELLFFGVADNRAALFSMDLANGRERRLVYSHPTLDVAGVHALGKYARLVAAAYVDDRPRLRFFDEHIGKVHAAVAQPFPDKSVIVIDEDWQRRYYLVFVHSDRDPGTYYRFDVASNTLQTISRVYPSLAERELAPMREVNYRAADGTPIPAYLTVPPNRAGAGPAVLLPHGGPAARDYWSYDFLAQFLAANGYAVLQSNYRGSAGYGRAWAGDGGFRGWRRAVDDIREGARYLVEAGIAAPDEICIVGWSYGGYAALMSSIEDPAAYRCAVSIAGVTDPRALGRAMRNFVGGLEAQTFIGTDDDVTKAGSPLERAEELAVPVLLVHPRKDINVPFQQSADLFRALRRADKAVDFVEYEHAEHSIIPERYRKDLLTRLAAFLETHIGE